jgi:serine/threonine protein kinase
MCGIVYRDLKPGNLLLHTQVSCILSASKCSYIVTVLVQSGGIVYRDLKPENLLLDTQVGGRVCESLIGA